MTMENLNLSDRQKLVLQCVIDASTERKRPFTKGIVLRMKNKGHFISEKQCAYDLGVIIRTKGTNVISLKMGGYPAIWIYELPKPTEVS